MLRTIIRFFILLVGLLLVFLELYYADSLLSLDRGEVLGLIVITLGLTYLFFSFFTQGPRYIPYREMSLGERRMRAERNANLALRKGRPDAAMQIYEDVGLLAKALEIAHQINDLPAQARISLAMGHQGRARRILLQMEDFESAAHCSLLMNEVEEAREYYAAVAEAAEKTSSTAEEVAGFWDRAGEYQKAGEMYEEAGALHKAAESYEILGDKRSAKRCEDQARAVEAFERRQASLTLGEQERIDRERKAAALGLAQALQEKGDFFGAGEQYRIADKMMEAGMAFERIEEWERAAKAYEAAYLPDRAELAMMHVGPKDFVDEELETAMGTLMAPTPGSGGPVTFIPISQAQAIPVHLAASGQITINPEAQEEMLQLVRKGNFAEAAEKAVESNNWPMAAAFFECGGALIRAADTYRQIGRTDEAVDCLDRAGKPREAALMSLAEGRQDRAARSLLEAMDNGGKSQDAGMLLMELLVSWGKCDEALALLRTRIAPGGITVETASSYYRFARLLENKHYYKMALNLYKEMIDAGATSDKISTRMAKLSKLIAIHASDEEELKEGDAPTKLVDEQESIINDLLVTALSKETPEEGELPTAAIEPGQTVTFAFQPPSEGEKIPVGAIGDSQLLAPAMGNFSLFGGPVGSDDVTSKDLLAGAGEEVAGKAAGAMEDIFASGQRYETREEIARGGMGVVYEAVDTMLQRPVALKLILSQAATQQGLHQFLVEARAIAQLSHPNVVMIYDIGLMDLQHYIAMELVKGGSLTDIIKEEKRLSRYESMRLFVETARGLQAAHEVGIIHRDIKPSNILLTDKRRVKIVDFGLAKIAQEEGAPVEKTMFRSSGTPGYMAPEQIRGEKLHPACDIYALGITLFHMLIGKPPHKVVGITKGFNILKFQVDGDLPSLKELRSGIPSEVDKIYRYCTATNPEDRYQSIDTFIETAEKWMIKLKPENSEEEEAV